MNLSDQLQPVSVGDIGGWLFYIRAQLHNVGTRWAARRQRAQEMDEISRFSDRDLWDLGLSRSDLHAIARSSYSRD